MPKEWTHWLLAEKTAGKVPTGPLKDALEVHHEIFLFGATLHDSPYYLPSRERLYTVSDRLHGRYGYDTFRPARVLAPRAFEAADVVTGSVKWSLDSPLAALLAGTLCHIAADTVFHPWVFYMTGSADSPGDDGKGRWMYRHREFETALDKYLAREWGRPSLAPLFDKIASTPEAVRTATLFFNEVLPCSQPETLAILKRHGRIKGLFGSGAGHLAASIQGVLRGKGTGRDFSSTFYGHRSRWRFALTEPLRYRHPLTGDLFETTLERLADGAVARGLEWLAVLERGGHTVPGSKAGFPDPSLHLDTGLPAVTGERMVYFNSLR